MQWPIYIIHSMDKTKLFGITHLWKRESVVKIYGDDAYKCKLMFLTRRQQPASALLLPSQFPYLRMQLAHLQIISQVSSILPLVTFSFEVLH